MIWLGSNRGYLIDWLTQKWVQVCGRRVQVAGAPWLEGPIGRPKGIGKDFFHELAREEALKVCEAERVRGLLRDIGSLEGPHANTQSIQRGVADFYERTSDYKLDAWSEWSGKFKPFGWLIAALFSRRLQQLNVPLSSLDTSQGMSSEVLQLVDPASGEVRHTAWVRELLSTNRVLYAGSYSTCQVPGMDGSCIKVVFPLPNGNAMVIMRPKVLEDGSLILSSSGRRFGDPGFYFTVHGKGGKVHARYLRTFRESIHVYENGDEVRADHRLKLWGMRFLQLHYRMRRLQSDGVGSGFDRGSS